MMHDRRVARGSTYAAMVIPAGTNPDTMLGGDKKGDTLKKKSFKKSVTFILNQRLFLGHIADPH